LNNKERTHCTALHCRHALLYKPQQWQNQSVAAQHRLSVSEQLIVNVKLDMKRRARR